MKFITTIIIIQLFATCGATTQELNDFISLLVRSEDTPENLTVVEQWQGFESRIKLITNALVKMILPRLMENAGKMNVSSQCMKDAIHVITGIKNIKPWALRFFDASAKSMDGILSGTFSSFGMYDECLDTIATSDRSRDRGKVLFRGQYCIIDLKPRLPAKKNYKMDDVLPELKNFSEGGTVISEAAKYAHIFHLFSLRLGICVPSGCSIEDVDNVVTRVSAFLSKELKVSAQASRCEVKAKKVFLPVQISILTAYIFTGFLVLIGTLIHIYSHYWKVIFRHTAVRAFLAFSVIANFKNLVNTKVSSDTLGCMSGIRFLCMTWIILGHTYAFFNVQMLVGVKKATSYAKDFAFQAVINASVAVDTFFCMGGLVLCYVMIKQVNFEKKPFSLTLYIIHRLWRIIPVYIYVVLAVFLRNLFGSGPSFYDFTNKYVQACYDNWWRNLIFINNFYNPDQTCIAYSWYIACDFQLYMAALLIMLPLLRWPKVGISLNVLTIIGCVIYSGVTTYVNDFPPTMLPIKPDLEILKVYLTKFYFSPFVHAGPYCIGILTGYILALKRNLKIPRAILVIGWCLAFIFNFSVLYGAFDWNRGVEPTVWGRILYASLSRTTWALGVAWMIVCCVTGYGGIINYILSWKVFILLGRLTFIAYLIHPLVQIFLVGNIRTVVELNHMYMVWLYFGHLSVTYIVAFAVNMLIESPLMALEKIINSRSVKDAEELPVVRNSNALKGTLKTGKIDDIAVMVPTTIELPFGVDNDAVVYRL